MQPLIDADVQVKTCRKCEEIKPLADFHPNKTCSKGVVGTCRVCTRERISKWYSDNRSERQEAANRRSRDRKREAVIQFFDRCKDCKQSFPDYVYEFHHLDPNEKDVNPSEAFSSPKWEKELDKCVMLCANCHRIRHHLMREELRTAKEEIG